MLQSEAPRLERAGIARRQVGTERLVERGIQPADRAADAGWLALSDAGSMPVASIKHFACPGGVYPVQVPAGEASSCIGVSDGAPPAVRCARGHSHG
jgi:hypothetical protein